MFISNFIKYFYPLIKRYRIIELRIKGLLLIVKTTPSKNELEVSTLVFSDDDTFSPRIEKALTNNSFKKKFLPYLEAEDKKIYIKQTIPILFPADSQEKLLKFTLFARVFAIVLKRLAEKDLLPL